MKSFKGMSKKKKQSSTRPEVLLKKRENASFKAHMKNRVTQIMPHAKKAQKLLTKIKAKKIVPSKLQEKLLCMDVRALLTMIPQEMEKVYATLSSKMSCTEKIVRTYLHFCPIVIKMFKKRGYQIRDTATWRLYKQLSLSMTYAEINH